MFGKLLQLAHVTAYGSPAYEMPRDPKWKKVSHLWLLDHPECLVCGTRENCEVHHKYPFHLYPELELDTRFFRTLCRPHHYEIGHGRDWKAFNPDVDQTIQEIHAVLTSRSYVRTPVCT